jgi:hypothetical protein
MLEMRARQRAHAVVGQELGFIQHARSSFFMRWPRSSDSSRRSPRPGDCQ